MPESFQDGNDITVPGGTFDVISENVAAVQAVAASGYVLVLNPLCDIYPVTVAANATAFVIPLPPTPYADIPPLQQIVILNRDATHTITPDVAGTSHVANGAGTAIAALTAKALIFDAGTQLWFMEN